MTDAKKPDYNKIWDKGGRLRPIEERRYPPDPDGIRAAAAEINDLYNPNTNAEYCRNGPMRLKKIRGILRREVEREMQEERLEARERDIRQGGK